MFNCFVSYICVGESVKDVIPLTGKEDNFEGVRELVHLTVLQANVAGAGFDHSVGGYL